MLASDDVSQVVAVARIDEERVIIRYDREFWRRQRDCMGKPVDWYKQWSDKWQGNKVEGLTVDIGVLF